MHHLSLHLQACSPERNIFRAYSIWVGQDLLGDWIVSVSYGRMGAKGTSKVYVFSSKEEVLPKIRLILRKRASSPKRLGCRYILKEVKGELQQMDDKLTEMTAWFA